MVCALFPLYSELKLFDKIFDYITITKIQTIKTPLIFYCSLFFHLICIKCTKSEKILSSVPWKHTFIKETPQQLNYSKSFFILLEEEQVTKFKKYVDILIKKTEDILIKKADVQDFLIMSGALAVYLYLLNPLKQVFLSYKTKFSELIKNDSWKVCYI